MTTPVSAFAFALAWKSIVVMGAAALVTQGMRRASAAARHLVWTLALAALLVLPAAMLLLPAAEVAVLPAPAAELRAQGQTPPAAPADRSPAPPEQVAPGAYPTPFGLGLSAGVGARSPVSAAASSSRTPFWLTLWTAGVLLVALRLGAGYAWQAASARRSERIVADAWRMLAGRLARLLGLRSEPPLLRASSAAMPMAWGVFRPVVLLPGGADAWPDERREVVLLHELAHIRRRDCLTQAIAQAACAVYWFNPLVWLAARRLRAERELACDDLVLRSGAEGPSYAAHLLELARTLRDVRGGGLATVAMARRSELEGRLLAILNPAQNRRTPGRRLSTVLATSLALGLLPLAAVRPVAGAAPAVVLSTVSPSEIPIETSPKLPAGVQRPAAEAPPGGFVREPQPRPATESTVAESVREPQPGPPTEMPAEPAEVQLSDAAIDALIAAIKDPDADVRRAAISALGKLRDSRTIEPLMAALTDASPDVRRYAAAALGDLRDSRAVPGLVRALDDESADVRRYAAAALGDLRDPQAIEPLIGTLGDGDADVRRYAASALGDLRDPSAVDPLAKALGDTDADVRRAAVSALGDIRSPRAVQPLIGRLRDEDPDVRRAAAYALGDLHDPAALDALTAAMKDENAEVRRAAISALADISGSDGVDPNPNPNPNPNPDPNPDHARGPRPGLGPGGGVAGAVDLAAGRPPESRR